MIIRLWYVYPWIRGYSSEGIVRFIGNLIKILAMRPEITIEIWCLSESTGIIKKFLQEYCENDIIKKLSFHSKKATKLLFDINTVDDSSAVVLVYGCSALFYEEITHKHKVLMLYDIFPVLFENLFLYIQENVKFTNIHLIKRLNRAADNGYFFLTISKYIINEHVLKFTNMKRENIDHVYLPCIPDGNKRFNIDILKKFNINFGYIIYPTQIRPHKNVEVILQAITILKKQNIKLKLVLTGKLSDFPPALTMADGCNLINKNKLKSDVIEVGPVTNEELNLLYRHSTMCIAPSLAEGGMPLPIFEAIANKTPVIAADIPVTRERLEFCNIDPEKSGLYLFKVHDAGALAEHIKDVLANREEIIAKQQSIKERLFAWNWNDVADKYINIFQKVLSRDI